MCLLTGRSAAGAYSMDGDSSSGSSGSVSPAVVTGVAVAVINLAVLIAVAVHFARKRTAAKANERRSTRASNIANGSKPNGVAKQNIGVANHGFRSSEVGTIRSLSSLASQFSIATTSSGTIEDDGNMSDTSSITSLA